MPRRAKKRTDTLPGCCASEVQNQKPNGSNFSNVPRLTKLTGAFLDRNCSTSEVYVPHHPSHRLLCVQSEQGSTDISTGLLSYLFIAPRHQRRSAMHNQRCTTVFCMSARRWFWRWFSTYLSIDQLDASVSVPSVVLVPVLKCWSLKPQMQIVLWRRHALLMLSSFLPFSNQRRSQCHFPRLWHDLNQFNDQRLSSSPPPSPLQPELQMNA